jgi:hypothetical protein
MRRTRPGSAMGATLLSLTLLLTAPDIGASQETVRSGLSADIPLSYHLSALHSHSWLTRNGIWVRHEGMWAFRPTFYRDWQAYFRCQAGHGCGGVGWASHVFWSWLPYGYAGWDLVPGGWMWFPGQRFANSRAWDLFWDLWFFSPRYGSGAYGFGPRFHPSLAATGWDGGLTRVTVDQRPGQGRDGWKPPTEAGTGDHTPPLVDPVRAAPIVTVSADGEDSGPSGRKAPQKPSIDPVLPTRPVETLFEPTSIKRAREKGLRRPGTDPLEPGRWSAPNLSRLAPKGLRLRSKSPGAFELTKPWVYRNRSTSVHRMPSARSWRGATRNESKGYRPAQPVSNGRSKSTGKKKPRQ